jgi:acyl carrier protein
LAAYIVTRPTGSNGGDPSALRRAVSKALAARLPEHMVPRTIIIVDAFPRTRNGKIDFRALPAPDAAHGRSRVAARTETEASLLAIWAETFKREATTIDVEGDEFLSLGGHSLLAIRVLGKVSSRFDLRLPLSSIFEHPSIASLAAHIDGTLRESRSAVRRPALVRIPRAAFSPALESETSAPEGTP